MVLPSIVLNYAMFIHIQVQLFCIDYRKRLIAFMFPRTHSHLRVSDKVWVGDGGATLFRRTAASVQDACNKRNFANRTEMVLRPPLPRQPKPQSHTKCNKRKWGMGGMHEQKKRCPMSNKKKKKKGQADRYVAEEKNSCRFRT